MKVFNQTPLYSRSQLIGRWYNKSNVQEDVQYIEQSVFYEDGTFEFEFSQCDKLGTVIKQETEYGEWGLVADIHFTITMHEQVDSHFYDADMTNENNYHAYRVLQLDHCIFQYEHVKTKEIYTLVKISAQQGIC